MSPEPEAQGSPAPSPRVGARRRPGRGRHDGARDPEPLPDQRAPQRAGPLRAAAAASELQPQPRRALVPRRQVSARRTRGGATPGRGRPGQGSPCSLFRGFLREFVEQEVADFARQNPGVVIYVNARPCFVPRVVAEYREWAGRGLRAACGGAGRGGRARFLPLV